MKIEKIQYIGDAYIQGLEKDGWLFGTHSLTNSMQAKVKENIWTPLPIKSQERMSFKIVDLNQLEEKIFDFVVISGDEIQSLKMSSCFNRPVLLLRNKFLWCFNVINTPVLLLCQIIVDLQFLFFSQSSKINV